MTPQEIKTKKQTAQMLCWAYDIGDLNALHYKEIFKNKDFAIKEILRVGHKIPFWKRIKFGFTDIVFVCPNCKNKFSVTCTGNIWHWYQGSPFRWLGKASDNIEEYSCRNCIIRDVIE